MRGVVGHSSVCQSQRIIPDTHSSGNRSRIGAMGYLARGTWVDEWYDTASSGGRFVRWDSRFRSSVRRGGDYPPEPGRYHLYVSWACPWASRTMIYRALKGLKDTISVTVVDPSMLSHG
jgi:glutathionyl-hydroquinone reductase